MKITNSKSQIPKGVASPTNKEFQITMTKITNKKLTKVFIINSEGSHGLHQDNFKLQTMTALIKSFCGGSRGAVFSKRAPLAAGGKKGAKNG
jgi:hypothetical protein